MSGRIEARLRELGIELPQPATPVANYVPFTTSGNLVVISGQVCQWIGEFRYVLTLGGRCWTAEPGRLSGSPIVTRVTLQVKFEPRLP